MSELAERLDTARDRLQATASPYMTVPEVAELARCEHKAVRRAIHDGLLTAFETNRRLVIRHADAVQWIESRPVSTSPRPRSRSQARRRAAGNVAAIREMEREARC